MIVTPGRVCLCVFLVLALVACGGGGGGSGDSDSAGGDAGSAGSGDLPEMMLVNAFPALGFEQPVDLQSPAGSGLLYVVERAGRIRVFDNDPDTTSSSLFLDIASQVDTNGEGGMLGLAFDPAFASNGRFYVFYMPDNNGDGDNLDRRIQVSRFTLLSGNPLVADETSEVEILTVAQPNDATNHNAGAIAFGPLDNYLYITLGDGGPGNDPNNNGQNRATLQGTIMRLDVSTSVPGGAAPNYSIPPDNPFVGNTSGFAEEIYAYGFRNPYRISFDQRNASTQDLWAGDVGQGAREEVDIVTNGGNYGWRIMEGDICRPPTTGCDMTGLTLPLYDYGISSGGQSITGGYVYRGSRIPELVGRYVFADFVTGQVWALLPESDLSGVLQVEEIANINARGIASLGRDNGGEVYILNLFSGEVLQLQVVP